MNPSVAHKDRLDWSIMIVIIIGTFMAILDGSIVNVALPQLMAIFNTSTDDIQWILTAYMLTLGVTMPASGFLADRFGYKRVYLFALGLFVLGSALCGAGWSVGSLVAARIIQAIGGGLMQPLGMAIIYQSYPRSKIGLVLGVWGIASMAAPAIGPTLGGYLVDYVNWRFIFLLNVPLGILNLFLGGLILKETPRIKGKHFDFVGLGTSVVGLFCLLLALSDGYSNGWTSPYIVSLFVIAAAALSLFVVNELRHPDPIVDLRLFKNTIFTLSIIIGATLAIAMFGAIFLVPMLLQNVLGQSAMKTGLILFPAALASGIVMPISGRLFDKYGARGIVIGGLMLVCWTTYIMASFDQMTPFSAMTWWMVIRGFGMGFAMMPVTTAGMNTVPPAMIGRASALSNVIRQVAASFGVAMFTTVMQTRQVTHFADLAATVNLSGGEYAALSEWMNQIALNSGLGIATAQGIGLSVVSRQLALRAMTQAIDDCFLIAAAIAVLALILSFWLKDRHPSHMPVHDPEQRPVLMEG